MLVKWAHAGQVVGVTDVPIWLNSYRMHGFYALEMLTALKNIDDH